MGTGIVNPGFSGSGLGQAFPSVPAIPREPQGAPQRVEATSSGLQKPEVPQETREGKASEGLVKEVAFANAIAEFLNQKVSFSYNKDIDQIVVKVTRGDTEEVIRQIPSKEMIQLITKFRKDFRGLIFNRTG